MTFAELTKQAQVHRLRRLALRAVDDYPIDADRVRLLEHGFNTTFRIDATSGQKYALRIDVNRRKPHAALRAEMAWLAALARDTSIVVPAPIRTHDDSLFTSVRFDDLDLDLHVAVMSWLPGRDLGEPTPVAVRAMGRLAAGLHDHAATWRPSTDATFPELGSVLMDSPDRIRPGHPDLSDDQHRVLTEAFAAVEPRFAALVDAGHRMPIHADLHPWNVKWLRGRMSVFDFDDAGMSVPAHDLTISMYYLLRDRLDEFRDDLFEGYSSVRPLPPFTDEQFQAGLAARALILVNDVLDITNRDIRDMVPRFVHNVTLRLRNYLDSGVFERNVPGIIATD